VTIHINQPPPLDQIKDVWPTPNDLMPRCKDCKWWIALDDEPDWGSCAATYQDSGIAHRVQVGDGKTADHLYTREDFGCIGWGERR